MGKMPAEAYLDKLLGSVNEQLKKDKFKDTARTIEDAANFWEGEDAEADFKELINKDKEEKEEKKSEREEILDALLSGAQNTEFGMNKRKPDDNPMYSRRVSRSEADFLKEFEAELEGEVDELADLFEEFELAVKPEDRLAEEDIPVEPQPVLEEETIPVEPQASVEEAEIPLEPQNDEFTLGEVDLASLVDEAADLMAGVSPMIPDEQPLQEYNAEPMPIEGMDDALADFFGGENLLNLADDMPAISESSAEGLDLGNLGDEDLMNLLAGTDDLSDIGNMLSHGEITEISMEEMDAFTVFAENEMSVQQISADPVPEETVNAEENKKNKKGGLFGVLKKILGNLMKDDENDEVTIKAAKGPTAENLSNENAEILAGLNSLESKPEKKEKKKKEKKPKKEKAPKKPKAPKAPKPKKEKKPVEVDNTPPLPKGPVIMIWLLAGSLVAFVLLGVNLIQYNTAMTNAKNLKNQGQYAEAFIEIKGLEIKDKDLEFYDQLAILSTVDSELNAYEAFSKANMQDKAFDSLICAIGRCYINEEEADVYGCLGMLETLKKTATNELRDKYQMTYEEAIEMYTIRDRDDYTIALYKKLTELGINWE